MGRFWPQNIVRLFAPPNSGNDLIIHSAGYDDFTDPAITPIFHPRSYNSYTLHFVLGGKGVLCVNGKMHTVEKNSLFFTPAKQEMAYYPCKDDAWEYAFLNFTGDQVPFLLNSLGLSLEQPILYDLPHIAIRQLIEQLLRTIQNTESQPYYYVIGAFYEMMHLCSRQTLPKGATQARYMIDTAYASSEFTIDQLCRDLHISHSHLCRIFKEHYGITAVRYLIDRRLEQARQLLVQTELSVKAIAFSCGFSDEIHFMKSFKSATGISAKQYRTVANKNE